MKEIYIVQMTDWKDTWDDTKAYARLEDAIKRKNELDEAASSCYEYSSIEKYDYYEGDVNET